MKKWLISFLLLCSIFIGYNKASALQVNAYYDSDFVNNIIDKNNIDDIDNILIPFIEENMKDYIVYIGLKTSNNYSSMFLRIMQKSSNHIPATMSYLRKDYSSRFYVSQPTSINNDNHFGSSFYNANYIEYIYNDYSVSKIVSDLQNWLLHPTFKNTDYVMEMFPIDNVIKNDSVDFLKSQVYARDNLPYYINFNLPMITSNSYSSYNTDYVVHYNNEEYLFNLGSTFPTYYGFVNNFILPKPIVKKFGSNQYGINSYNINYYSGGFTNLKVSCPTIRDFTENGFCNIFGSDYDDLATLSNSYFDVEFPFLSSNNVSVPIKNNHYYIFTFRYDSYYSLIPTRLSYFDHLYNTNQNVDIVDFNIIDKGIYKDMQLVFKSDLLGENDSSIDYITITFDNLGDYDVDIDLFKYGAYKSYKLTDFGTQLPNFNDLSNDYSKNDIDVVANGGNSSSNFFTKFSINDHGLSTFVTAPIRLFQALRNTTCETITLPVPHLGNMQLPCISSIFQQNLPDVFNIYQLIMSGIICYYIGLNYFRIIKNAFNPEDDRIEVQDL